MAHTVISSLPEPEEIHQEFPPSAERVLRGRREIEGILRGEDKRKIIVVGPCSAWPTACVVEYADRLARLQEDVRDRLLLVLRCYIQKPRTVFGWTGTINLPDPLGDPDLRRGIEVCAEMMSKASQDVPIADEMLFTHNKDYFGDYLSYSALGARSSEDPEHRSIASGFDPPMGVKHGTDGNLEKGVNSVQVVQASNDLALHGKHIRTHGNKYAHLILRGGERGPNYDPRSLAHATKLLLDERRKIENPAIIVDASHDNSRNGQGKDPSLQKYVVRNVLDGIVDQREEYTLVKGFMLESFLRHGSQKIGAGMAGDGLSITDPCLGWAETQRLLRETADRLDHAR
jgi:3-deoxy-7-phosphoheptulonate synthase